MDPDADTSPIDHDPAVAELLTFFDHDHLPPELAEVARPFGAAARALAAGNSDLALGLARHSLPGREGVAMSLKLMMMQDAQRAWDRHEEALRLLLEAKDCAVRAVLVLRRERPELLDSLAGAEACTTILAGPGRMADLETIGAVEPGATVDPIGHMVGRLTERGRWLARIASAKHRPADVASRSDLACRVSRLATAIGDVSTARAVTDPFRSRLATYADGLRGIATEIENTWTGRGAAEHLTRVHAALNRAGVPGSRSDADQRVDALAARCMDDFRGLVERMEAAAGRMEAATRADGGESVDGKGPIDTALGLVYRYGGIDGEHHKQWLLDQIVRALTGDGYEQWLADFNADDEYSPWDTGIAP